MEYSSHTSLLGNKTVSQWKASRYASRYASRWSHDNMISYVIDYKHNIIFLGVYLSLNGTKYANNSVISITEIGETDPDLNQNDGLQCITDRRPCCRFRYRVGEWFFPNGTEVPVELQHFIETEVMTMERST